ncbi:MAG: sigma-70 family RNA polymerase sigma factor [Myxococcota bacterium]
MDTTSRSRNFLHRLDRFERLTAEEERALARRSSQGDRRARNRLVEASLPYARAMAARLHRYGVPLEELVSEATLGLIRAAEKFDPERGVRFNTYATPWMRSYLMNHIVRSSSSFGGSSQVFNTKFWFQVRRERAKLQAQRLTHDEIVDVLAVRLGKSSQAVQTMLDQLDQQMVSLSGTEPGKRPWSEKIPTDSQPLDELTERVRVTRRVREKLPKAMRRLDKRGKSIVRERLMSDAPATLDELGKRHGISRERVRQIETKTKHVLRRYLEPLQEAV